MEYRDKLVVEGKRLLQDLPSMKKPSFSHLCAEFREEDCTLLQAPRRAGGISERPQDIAQVEDVLRHRHMALDAAEEKSGARLLEQAPAGEAS